MSASLPYAEVIGDPIAHSKSPLIHKFWLEKLGINADYRACHVKPEELANYFENRRADKNWRGCNVTIPHKIAVMDHVDDPGEVKNSIGAMNTVARDGGRDLFGTNTDAGGFFAPLSDREWRGASAVVIGAGGASRAVLFALKQAQVGHVSIFNRNVLKASALLALFGLKGEAKPLDTGLPEAELLVNTSALGMTGYPPLDVNLSPLPESAMVYDLVYSPLDTPLLAQAEQKGLSHIDGLTMLIGQAGFAFELFFGVAPPQDCDDELRALLIA